MDNQAHYRIHISKLNEVYLKIECDNPGICYELVQYFTFEVPGHKFMPAYRNKMWDGKIRLFSDKTGKIYVGLLDYIKEFCDRNEIGYDIDDDVDDTKNVDKNNVEEFIKSLKPKSKGKDLTLRDYQSEAIWYGISKNRGMLISPTASGKSLIIYALIRYYNLLLKGKKILILVPTTSLVEQMYSDFIDYGWDDKYLHRIYQGHEKDTDKPVIISTWQSLYKLDKKYFENFGCVVGDEAHLFKSKSLTTIMTKLINCKYRFGMTGTLDGTQTHRLVLEGLFGKVKKVTTTKELIDKDTLASLKIKCIVLKHKEEDCKAVKDLKYSEEIQYIVSHKTRNDFISRLCDNLSGNTLCLYQLVEKHGLVLYNLMKDFNRKVFFIHGGVDTEDREKIRAITEKETNAIIIASYGTFSTGINIRNLHNVVFASPSKSRIRVLQSIGRGLRKSDRGDIHTTLLDIADDFSYKDRKNFTLNHFLERINIYNEEQFEYQIDKIRI
jgi:superfamily II DNA or RNA helicase